MYVVWLVPLHARCKISRPFALCMLTKGTLAIRLQRASV